MNYETFFNYLEEKGLITKLLPLRKSIENIKDHGDYNKYLSILQALPNINPSEKLLNSDSIKIGRKEDIDEDQYALLLNLLKKLIPWRKGPYNFFGIEIDAEWRSEMKWNRLKDEVSNLENKLVLDVGSGNGYHCWRMKGCGAEAVIGVDPYLLSVVQFNVVRHFLNDEPVWVLPIGVEVMPQGLNLFDVVFSMGVLYHRRSPFDHLFQLKSFLKEGGELVLETLVIEGKINEVLTPSSRYAKMRNVWFIPSTLTLELWLKRAGFKNIHLLDVTPTTLAEQRKTEWMPWESLQDFLMPGNNRKTIEGYPAPLRAIFICNKE